jgi:hypothetical protein
MKKLPFLMLIIVLSASSCQKHLEREYAKRMIINSENYPIKQNYEITKSYIKDMNTTGRGVSIVLGEDEFKEKEKTIEQFKDMGLLLLNELPHREERTAFLLGTTVRTWTSVEVSLTETGNKYLVQKKASSFIVNLWETDINEITGIQEMQDQKTASVEYTISNKNITPFGSVFSDKNKVRQKSAIFSLYDDGWRLQ